MIHERRQEGEECNALKEMPISLWILHLIKNTAADTSIQEAEGVKERGVRRKEKVRRSAKKRGKPCFFFIRKGTLAELEK